MNKKKFNSAPEFIKKMDWTDLKGQKTVLIKLADTIHNTNVQPGTDMVVLMLPKDTENVIEGILGLIDATQDYAVDVLGIPEMHVFDFDKKDVSVVLCASCNSDDVSTIGQGENKGFCLICGKNVNTYKTELKADAKVIGYQVLGAMNTKYEGNIHPEMSASFSVYNLKQARKMRAGDTDNWLIVSVWTGDIEEPTFMFRGDPRK